MRKKKRLLQLLQLLPLPLFNCALSRPNISPKSLDTGMNKIKKINEIVFFLLRPVLIHVVIRSLIQIFFSQVNAIPFRGVCVCA